MDRVARSGIWLLAVVAGLDRCVSGWSPRVAAVTSSAALDTPAAVGVRVVQAWRALSPRERFERVGELNDACDRMAEAGVRRRYPDADEREVRLRVFALRLGRDLMVEVYGWDPDVQGW
jgi:hypothetical protein